MIARMPELSLSETSARLKPSSEFDFLLGENAFGAALGRLDEVAIVDHGGPMRGHRLGAALGLGRRGGLGVHLGGGLLGFERHAPFGGKCVLVYLVLGHSLSPSFPRIRQFPAHSSFRSAAKRVEPE